MRTISWIAAATAAAALTGCVSYPVYQPAPVARLTPEQSAALANRPIDPAQQARDAQSEANFQRQDQAAQQAVVPYTYAYGVPAVPYYYDYGYYPYYGGFYPYYGGLSLSFGYRGGWGGYRGYRGGYGGGHGHR